MTFSRTNALKAHLISALGTAQGNENPYNDNFPLMKIHGMIISVVLKIHRMMISIMDENPCNDMNPNNVIPNEVRNLFKKRVKPNGGTPIIIRHAPVLLGLFYSFCFMSATHIMRQPNLKPIT